MRLRTWWRPLGAAGWLAVVAGCSLMVDTSMLTTSAPDGGDVADALAEGAVPDAAPPEDGASDAPQVRFCEAQSPTPFFCQDFEDGDLTGAFRRGGRTVVAAPLTVGAAEVELSSIAHTGSFAFASTVASAPSVEAGGEHARFESPVDILDAGRVRLSFAMRTGTVQSNVAFVFVFVRDEAHVPVLLAQIYAYEPGQGYLSLSGPTESARTRVFELPADDAWARYGMLVDVPTGRVSLSVDGVDTASLTYPTGFAIAPRVDYALGLLRVSGSAALTTLYDDILFETLDP